MITKCVTHKEGQSGTTACLDCRRAYSSAYQRKERAAIAEMLNNYKLEKGCAHCGYAENVAALEFDHINPRTDTHKKWQGAKYKKEALQLMADPNIQVLCSNCHSIKTRTNNDHKIRQVQ